MIRIEIEIEYRGAKDLEEIAGEKEREGEGEGEKERKRECNDNARTLQGPPWNHRYPDEKNARSSLTKRTNSSRRRTAAVSTSSTRTS